VLGFAGVGSGAGPLLLQGRRLALPLQAQKDETCQDGQRHDCEDGGHWESALSGVTGFTVWRARSSAVICLTISLPDLI
jgi:hypothetical protein